LNCPTGQEAGQQLHRSHSSGQASERPDDQSGRWHDLLHARHAGESKGVAAAFHQKPGLGFPLVRLVAVISLDCAAVLDVRRAPTRANRRGRAPCFGTLLQSVEKEDVLLAAAITRPIG